MDSGSAMIMRQSSDPWETGAPITAIVFHRK
jgi:hypothetical protein